jgi:hypothetical protein
VRAFVAKRFGVRELAPAFCATERLSASKAREPSSFRESVMLDIRSASLRREAFGVRRLAGAFEVEGRPAGEKAGASSRTPYASRRRVAAADF